VKFLLSCLSTETALVMALTPKIYLLYCTRVVRDHGSKQRPVCRRDFGSYRSRLAVASFGCQNRSLIIFLQWTFALHLYPFFSRLSRSDSPDSYDSNGTTYARRYGLVTELRRCGVCRTFVCPFLERSVLTQFLEFQGVSYVVGKVLARGIQRQQG
jgi:hypothetical protein